MEGRPGTHWVDVDAEAAVRGVLDHLHEQGARRIAVVSPAAVTRFHTDARDAYHRWCAEHGTQPQVTLADGPSHGPVIEAVEAALSAPDRPDALFLIAEVSPPLVLDVARRRGRSVPDDLLLVCASEDPAAEHSDPPVTTLSLQPNRIAEAGIGQLVAALGSGSQEPTGILVDTELEIRASSRRG